MKLTCKAGSLLPAWRAVASAANGRTDVHRSVLIDADEASCRLRGTNINVYMRASVPDAAIGHPGKVLLNAGVVSAILRETQEDQDVVFTEESNGVIITAGRAQWELPTIAADKFPDPPHVDGDELFSLPAEQLRSMLSHTLFCVSATHHKAAAAVCFEVDNLQLSSVATDGRRMAIVQHEADAAAKKARMLIPSSAMSALALLRTGTVSFAVSFSTVRITAEPMSLWVKLADGAFPKWRDVLNAKWQFTGVCHANARELLQTVRHASIANDDTCVWAEIAFSGDKLVVSAVNDGNGAKREGTSARITCPCRCEGEPVTLRINSVYLCDYLMVVDGSKDVRIQLGADAPMTLTHEDGSRYLLMPLKA